MTARQLIRVRWAIRAVLVLGLAASTAANILHAQPSLISRCIAAWPVVALYLTIEVISRVPIHRRALAGARLVAAAVIAGIAAWVSYWHMAEVASRFGESGASPFLLPLSVDGLIVVASICLVELGGRIRAGAEVAERAQQKIDTDQLKATAPADSAAGRGVPTEPTSKPDPGSTAPDEPAAQPVRQDPRTAQEIEAAVRAIRVTNPGWSQRKVAAAARTSPTNAGRIIREAKTAAAEQDRPPADVAELASANR